MEIKELLVNGTTKKVYATNQSDQVLIEFQDKLPLWISKSQDTVRGKAAENNAISCFMFQYLESYNVPTHFIKEHDAKSFLAKRLEMIPIQLVIWNAAVSELSKRFGLESGKVLEYPIIEMYLKNEKLKFPMINEYHAYALGLCERNDMNAIMRVATKVNAVLKSFFQRKGIQLVNLRLEFGRLGNQIVLGDEVSADTLLIWEVDDKGKVVDPKKYDISANKSIKTYRAIREIIVGKNE